MAAVSVLDWKWSFFRSSVMHSALARSVCALIGRAAGVVVVPVALGGAPSRGFAQDPTWLREFGGTSDDDAWAVLTVEPGRLLVGGGTYGPLFGPIISARDAFLAWFDDAGNLLGGVQFGSDGAAGGLAPALDGGVFVAGSTSGSFGAPNAGDQDAWLARCDGKGNRIWVRQLGSSEADHGGYVATDGVGGVVIAGTTFGDLGGPAYGASDMWMARYDGGGIRLWLLQLGTQSSDFVTGIAPDGHGGFYLSGTTFGSLASPSAGSGDAWLARFDAAGNPLWARQFGSTLLDTCDALCSDGVNGVLVAGSTAGVLAGSQPGGTWLARYDTLGDRSSIIQFASNPNGWPEAVCTDGFGGAFVSGSTVGSLGGPHVGGNDVWVAHVQGGTRIDWIDQFGSTAFDYPTALAPGSPGTVFATGYTFGSLAPGGGGGDDAWLTRYDLCYADCNADGLLTVSDFGCFQTRFIAADVYTDCNANGALTVSDFGCFQTKFVTGCP